MVETRQKKQVKIREIVQYKLPDDEDNFTQNKLQIKRGDSPILANKQREEPKKNTNKKITKDNKRSKSNGNQPNNVQFAVNKTNQLTKIPPSIPSYSKNLNMSISGTSVLNKN